MKWDVVLELLLAEIMAHAVLGPLYGPRVRKAAAWPLERPPEMPLLEWTLISNTEDELWAPCTFQFDQWALNEDDLITSERWLRRLFHQDLPTDFGGLTMWAQYADSAELASADRDGFSGRALRFRFTPLRDRYDPVLPTS